MNTDIVEVWKDIIGFEGLYQISNSGKVKSFKRSITGQIMTPAKSGRKRNYLAVVLSKDGVSYSRKIARLVAQHFVDNPDNKPEVNHENGDTFCNWYWNLKWVTTLENILHARDTGLSKPHPKEVRKRINEMVRKVLSYPILNTVTGEKYSSLKEAHQKLGISISVLSSHIHNKVKKPIWKRI